MTKQTKNSSSKKQKLEAKKSTTTASITDLTTKNAQVSTTCATVGNATTIPSIVNSQKQSKSEKAPTDSFDWVKDCFAFLIKNSGHNIESMDDPRINVIDRFLKMNMDGLRNHPDLLKEFEGSPLNAMDFILKIIYKEHQDPFTLTVYKRVQEDLLLRKLFNAKGSAKSKTKVEALRKLKERGLLT